MMCHERMLTEEVQQNRCTSPHLLVSGKDPQAPVREWLLGEVERRPRGLLMSLLCQQLAGVWTNRSQSSARAARVERAVQAMKASAGSLEHLNLRSNTGTTLFFIVLMSLCVVRTVRLSQATQRRENTLRQSDRRPCRPGMPVVAKVSWNFTISQRTAPPSGIRVTQLL